MFTRLPIARWDPFIKYVIFCSELVKFYSVPTVFFKNPSAPFAFCSTLTHDLALFTTATSAAYATALLVFLHCSYYFDFSKVVS